MVEVPINTLLNKFIEVNGIETLVLQEEQGITLPQRPFSNLVKLIKNPGNYLKTEELSYPLDQSSFEVTCEDNAQIESYTKNEDEHLYNHYKTKWDELKPIQINKI